MWLLRAVVSMHVFAPPPGIVVAVLGEEQRLRGAARRLFQSGGLLLRGLPDSDVAMETADTGMDDTDAKENK